MLDRAVSRLTSKLKLLTVGNPKIAKGMSIGYATAGLHLAPARESGYNTCPMHTAECAAACLNTAGRGAMQKIQSARIRKTLWYYEDRSGFLEALHKDIAQFIKNAAQENLTPAFRLNLTSDLRWENHSIPQTYAAYQFYDYSKILNRTTPPNYHLTFSYSGHNLADCKTALSNGMNVAVPFNKQPDTWYGYKVIEGDSSDLRFLNQGNGPYIIALKPKGKLRNDPTSVFLGDNA